MRGKDVGGVAYGYRLLPEPDEHGARRAVDHSAAPILLFIFEDIDAGLTPTTVCQTLNQESVRTPGGGIWRPRTLLGARKFMSGLLGNPLYIGKMIYGKTISTFVASTGQTKVSVGDAANQIVIDVPHLRLIPDDLWLRVQDILSSLSTTMPHRVRRPPYLFSGLSFCGCGGESYITVSRKFGCDGVRYKNGCTNRHQVGRAELQDAVLQGLRDRLIRPGLLSAFISEHRLEFAASAATRGDRRKNLEGRLKECGRGIENLLELARLGSGGTGREMILREMDRLGDERKQIEKELRHLTPTEAVELDDEQIVTRLDNLIDNLGEALNGPERDAARARDILRSFVEKVVVTPLGEGDGRGAGPVRITVHGRLNDLLDAATQDRQTTGSSSTLLVILTSTTHRSAG